MTHEQQQIADLVDQVRELHQALDEADDGYHATRLRARQAQIASLRRTTNCFRWPLEVGRRLHATAGLDPATGPVHELFLRGGGRVGTEIDHLLDHIAAHRRAP